jgi:outer membrane murein-binding lipoprotein Lpp
MGIFNLFKKKNKVKEEIIFETMSIDLLEEWIQAKKEEQISTEEMILEKIKEKTKMYLEDITIKLETLKEINVSEKTKDIRVSSIVNQSLEGYVGVVNEFIQKLQDLEKTDLNEFIKDVDNVFETCHKKSKAYYGKVTYLIGKEAGDVREAIIELSKEIVEIIKINDEEIKKSTQLSNLTKLLKNYYGEVTALEQIKKEVEKLKKEIEEKEEEVSKRNKEIEIIVNSSEYKENEKRKENLETERMLLKELQRTIKLSIDFKSLTSIYHSSTKDMEKVKHYRDNFNDAFSKDSGGELRKLLEGTSMDTSKSITLMEKYQLQIKEIKQLEESIKEDKTNGISNRINRLSEEIQRLHEEKERKSKNIEAVKENMNRAFMVLEDAMDQFNIKLNL